MLRRAEQLIFSSNYMVPTAGLEPAQVAPLAPQTSASTNFATSALHGLRPNFQRGSPSEPRKLAALRAGKKFTRCPITSEAALDSASRPVRSPAAAAA
jgi:hypothetical protein